MRLQWANAHRSWRADWQQVVFSENSRFNMWHHDGRIRVRRFAGERHIRSASSNATVDEHPELWSEVPIAYHGRSQLLRIVGNLNSTRYISESFTAPSYSFPARIARSCIPQDNARPHVTKSVKILS
ncbi:transposable element Tc1 transposase [Trichonephila clavipes]|nr:transposable element Tc1 transposase [Trichonephila clavipes]